MLYLDHAATTVMRPETREAMAPFLDGEFGNPSGVHAVSRAAKNAMEEARESAAEILGADHPLEIVFTGGGTEADNLAILGRALAGGRRGSVVTNAAEHDAVLQSADFAARLGCGLTIVGVDESGLVDPAAYGAATTPATAVASVMLANNEIGTVQPVADVAAAVRDVNPDVAIHTDAVQAFVSEEVTVQGTGADLIALSAHKFGGPKGVGLLRVPRDMELEPVVHGGGQELGMRSGTHNVAGIVGMAAAMKATAADRDAFRIRVRRARDQFEKVLSAQVPGIEVNGPAESRLVQHSHLRIEGVQSETLLIRLDQAGLAAAAGSACHSGAVEVSHVLAAMGFDEDRAAESVRFSFGWVNDTADGEDAARRVAAVVEQLR
jgi:cysteine desulfurase